MYSRIEGENLRDSVGLEKQLNNVRYDWQGGENSNNRARRLVLYEIALQLDKIIALFGPSCRFLHINMCIPYPVETNEAGQARADANPTPRANRLAWMPSDWTNNIE